MILNSSAVTIILFLAALVASNPVRPGRQAHVVPIRQHRRSFGANVPISLAAVQEERARLLSRYEQLAASYHQMKREERMLLNPKAFEPFDIDSLKKRDGSGAASLDDDSDTVYTGPIQVGTPPQEIVVQVDTGSAELVIFSKGCSECGSPIYDPSLSSTVEITSTPISIRYGSGNINGTLAYDTVTFAGLTVERQGFTSATEVDEDFLGSDHGRFQGLQGFAWPALAQGDKPFFWNLVAENKLASNVFSVFLARNTTGSELCLGCVSSSKYTTDIQYFPLNASATGNVQKYWTITADSVAVGGESATTEFACALDTGSTAIDLPTHFAEKVYAKIPGAIVLQEFPSSAVVYGFPCEQQLPEIAIVLGGQSYPVDPRDLILGLADSTLTSKEGYCVGAIFGFNTRQGSINGDLALVGDAFLKNYYSVYDAGRNRVGLAKSNQ